ncbi:MAG TPA: TA system VapC family ribonuclease toxin [Vicinamibacteria bacterium]|nr:TA system VapC family ribonuclease toxin [Vicinamibacteria bacterium]
MIAVDTNILVYAHRRDSPWHGAARTRVAELAQGRGAWAIPWPCVHEFLGIVTHPRIYARPTPLDAARTQVDAWLESPGLVLLAETAGYWMRLRALLESGRVSGPQVHDARVAALCLHHGVTRLWTADRDFSRFPELPASNPLLG